MAEILLESEATPTADVTRLLAATRPFHGRGGCERSVKIVTGGLFADRFLLSFHKRAFGPDPLPAIERIAAALSLPEAYRAPLREHLHAADIIHFGYEGTKAGTTYKLYLEFATVFRAGLAAAQSRGETLLLHHAFKWDPAEPRRRAVAQYCALPCRTLADFEQALASLAGEGSPAVLRLAEALLGRSLTRAKLDDLLLMAVEEPGSPRRSFDLNLYPAGLALASVLPDLDLMLRQLMISPVEGRRVLDRFADRTLGHVSGGTGRGGEDFVTLYFGAEPIQ